MVGFIGNPLLKCLQVQDADQGITTADAVVQESQGLPWDVAFNPKGHLAQFHGQRVLVHAIDAVGDHVAHGLTRGFGRGFFFARTDARQLVSQSSGRGQQKVTGAARRVEDADRQDGTFLFLRSLGRSQASIDYRAQGAFHKLSHQLRGGVVGASALALHALGELELLLAAYLDYLRPIVQEAFVDRAQLLDVQGCVVHPTLGFSLLIVIVDQISKGLQKVAVGDTPALQIDILEEAAVEHWQIQEARQGTPGGLGHWLRVAQELPQCPETAPEVIVVGVCFPPVYQSPKPADAVMLAVEVVPREQSPLFCNQEEQEPVH